MRRLRDKSSEFSILFNFHAMRRNQMKISCSVLLLSFSLQGHDPRSSAAFRLIQQHALEHSSMEFSDDESLEHALAGSFNTSEDFRRVGRWAAGVCKGTKFDPARMRNLPQV